MLDFNIEKTWTSILEGFMIRCGSANIHQKMCVFKGVLNVNYFTLIVNVIERTYMTTHRISTRIFTMTLKTTFIQSPKIEANGYRPNLDLLIIFSLFACFISYYRWAHREHLPSIVYCEIENALVCT